MPQKQKSLLFLLFLLAVGILIGNTIGVLLGLLLPEGIAKDVLTKSAVVSFGPGTFDIRILQLTFGITLRINLIGLLGIPIAAYIFKWY